MSEQTNLPPLVRLFSVTVQNGIGDQAEVTNVSICSRFPVPPCLATTAVRRARQVLPDVGPWKMVGFKESIGQ